MIPKKVLIFNPFGIGDVLFTTPLIENLRRKIPQVSISYICNIRVYPLLAASGLFDKVLVFEKDDWRRAAQRSKLGFIKKIFIFYREIQREKYDVVFDFSLNVQYGFFLMLTGIRRRIGFNFKSAVFFTDKIDIPDGTAISMLPGTIRSA